MVNDKHLKLRAASTSGLGRVLTHLQLGPTKVHDLASITLQGRFLPFAMDRNEPEFRSVAIRCATECEAWARAIREYAELEVIPSTANTLMSQSSPSVPHSHVEPDKADEDEDEDEDDEIQIDESDDLGF